MSKTKETTKTYGRLVRNSNALGYSLSPGKSGKAVHKKTKKRAG